MHPQHPVKQLLNELVLQLETSTARAHPIYEDPLMPKVTLAYTQSMDGYIAGLKQLLNGEMQSVPMSLNSTQSLAMLHYLRSYQDAIMIGLDTFLIDNPRLTARKISPSSDSEITGDLYARQPTPVVLCPDILQTVERIRKATGPHQHEHWHLFARTQSQQSRPIFIINSHCPLPQARENDRHEVSLAEHRLLVQNAMVDLVRFGAHVVSCPPDPVESRHCDIRHALSLLKQEMNFHKVLVEGGSKLLTSLLRLKLFDSVVITMCPVYLFRGVKCPQFVTSTEGGGSDAIMRFSHDCIEYVRVGNDLVTIITVRR